MQNNIQIWEKVMEHKSSLRQSESVHQCAISWSNFWMPPSTRVHCILYSTQMSLLWGLKVCTEHKLSSHSWHLTQSTLDNIALLLLWQMQAGLRHASTSGATEVLESAASSDTSFSRNSLWFKGLLFWALERCWWRMKLFTTAISTKWRKNILYHLEVLWSTL